MTQVVSPRLVPPGLLVGLGAVVFLANAGLLVLQLLAGRFLAPFIGSSVETWTCVIGVFLTGIALGNHYGGKLADRNPSTRALGRLLVLGGLGALSMILWYIVCRSTGPTGSCHSGRDIPILAAVFCLPPAFVLSLMTPLTIKLDAPGRDAGRAGGRAGVRPEHARLPGRQLRHRLLADGRLHAQRDHRRRGRRAVRAGGADVPGGLPADHRGRGRHGAGAGDAPRTTRSASARTSAGRSRSCSSPASAACRWS